MFLCIQWVLLSLEKKKLCCRARYYADLAHSLFTQQVKSPSYCGRQKCFSVLPLEILMSQTTFVYMSNGLIVISNDCVSYMQFHGDTVVDIWEQSVLGLVTSERYFLMNGFHPWTLVMEVCKRNPFITAITSSFNAI